jgi:uncharacterized membrane protein
MIGRNMNEKLRKFINVQTALVVTLRLSLSIAFCSLIYLLFIFGHTEETPMSHVVGVTILAAISALVGGLLQWIGLPAKGGKPTVVKHGKRQSTRTGK